MTNVSNAMVKDTYTTDNVLIAQMNSSQKNQQTSVNLVTPVVKLVPDTEATNVLMPNYHGI